MPQQERAWLELAKNGDTQAFSRLVERYQGPVYNLCYRMLGNAQEAEDAAQETFLRAFKALDRFDLDRKFASWLLSIAANYSIDQHRRRRFHTVELDDAPAAQLAVGNPGVESQLMARESEEAMEAMLATLGAKDRAALILHYWYDYSYREIAAELDLTESAVKSRMHRARKELALAWQKGKVASFYKERRQHEAATV